MLLRITKSDVPSVKYALALHGIPYDLFTDEKNEGLAFVQIEGYDHLLFYLGREVEARNMEREQDEAADKSLFNLFKVKF